MAKAPNRIDVYIENGQKRTFAGAIDWPGWCRSGPDEDSALQALKETIMKRACHISEQAGA